MDTTKKTIMEKIDFTPYTIGTVFNPIIVDPTTIRQIPFKKITLKYPSRLEAMAIDPSKIATNDNLRYTPGQIDFTVKLFKTVSIETKERERDVEITEKSPRQTLIRHAVELMRAALKFKQGFRIHVKDDVDLRHCGLGSSSSLIAGVACAINELFGKPISDRRMVKYLAQNHGEEIDGNNEMINPVQCIGGSAACGTHEGGIIIIAGESCVVKTMNIPEEYDVVVGIPKDFEHPDSKYLMDKEIENFPKFLECGKKYGPTIAYRLFHECFPVMECGKEGLNVLGNLIYDYRFTMGSIENCSFVYPPMVDLTKSLAYLKLEGKADVLTISSVGPGIFAVTKEADECEQAFQEKNMRTIRTKIHNGRYEILELE